MSLPSWEVVYGRCGSCTQFRKDFGGSTGKVYGHCAVKPRAGSISSADAKCDVYAPIEAVAPERRPEPPPPTRPAPRPAVDPFDVDVNTPHAEAREPIRRPVKAAPVLVRRPSQRDDDDDDVPASPEGGASMDKRSLRRLIREAIEDSLGIGEVETLDRFKDGTIIVQPGVDGAQPKTLPIEALLHKVIMVRDNLRVLEQKINAHPKLEDTEKVVLQQYITRCYGSLTTFNMLFKHREDWFKGGGD